MGAGPAYCGAGQRAALPFCQSCKAGQRETTLSRRSHAEAGGPEVPYAAVPRTAERLAENTSRRSTSSADSTEKWNCTKQRAAGSSSRDLPYVDEIGRASRRRRGRAPGQGGGRRAARRAREDGTRARRGAGSIGPGPAAAARAGPRAGPASVRPREAPGGARRKIRLSIARASEAWLCTLRLAAPASAAAAAAPCRPVGAVPYVRLRRRRWSQRESLSAVAATCWRLAPSCTCRQWRQRRWPACSY